MKVLGMVAALIFLSVGMWAHIRYRSIVQELRNEHGAPQTYGPIDSVLAYFGFDSDSSIYKPRPAVTSGVHQNPHLQ